MVQNALEEGEETSSTGATHSTPVSATLKTGLDAIPSRKSSLPERVSMCYHGFITIRSKVNAQHFSFLS